MTDSGGGLAGRMDGLLFFPVTPFGPGGEVDLDVYRQHLKARLEAGPAAVFAGETVAELAAHPRIVGFKDGRGDLDLMRRIVGTVRARHGEDALVYFNGLPTAEMTQLPYRAVGVPHYSSAVFCFAPDIAMAFYRAYRSGDDATCERLLDGFFRPYVELRAKGPGYTVALVKAGVRLEGLDVGPVRAPLSEPDPAH